VGTSLTFSPESARPDIAQTLTKFDLEADQQGFVGLKIAPVLEVFEQHGFYPVIEPGELLKDRRTERSSDGTYARGGGTVSRDSYATEEHGMEERVDDRLSAIHRSYFDAEALAGQRTRDAVLRNHNARVIDAAINAAGSSDTVSAWTDTEGADPVKDIRDAALDIRGDTGIVMDLVLCMEWSRFQHLKDCESIIDRLKFAGFQNPNRDNITATALANIFDISEVIVSRSMKNTAAEPKAVSFATMWPEDKAMLFIRSNSSDTLRPQFMRTLHWGADGSAIGSVMESYYSEERRSNVIRHRMDTQEKVLYDTTATVLDV
jgi:hypothetical protein